MTIKSRLEKLEAKHAPRTRHFFTRDKMDFLEVPVFDETGPQHFTLKQLEDMDAAGVELNIIYIGLASESEASHDDA